MSTETPNLTLEEHYRRAADNYMRRLKLRNFMETLPAGTQRAITLTCLRLVRRERPDFHVFNELLVQYPRPGKTKPGQVVPDNMVVMREQPFDPKIRSFNVPTEGVIPFWVLEYVSKGSKRKDYEKNYLHYERELRVPYYLLFEPEIEQMRLYRHDGTKYVEVEPDANGRCAIDELELEVGMLEGWVRYWFRGELLLLPEELQSQAEVATKVAADTQKQATEERNRRLAVEAKLQANETKLQANETKLQASEAEITRLRAELDAARHASKE